MAKIEILECTLRDGSYSIDFQFTPKDTAVIAAALENVGFKFIEIGHGVGLNAGSTGKGLAAASDEEYMAAAANTLNSSDWGMFFIPGIGRKEDLDLAADYGMGFVRIGTNANEVEQSEAYIAHAKKLGMNVSANLMKSYIYSCDELALKAKMSQEYGADLVCLVDSAGTMLPEDIKKYIIEMKTILSVPVGLHCHDNLALGIANCLKAIECGAQRVDSTLQGMGRGGGNPATEVLLTVLKKAGYEPDYNINRVMDISQKLIRPLLNEKGLDSIDITSGFAGFHSSYLGTILKYSDNFGLDPRELIVEVCKADKVDASEDLVMDIAAQLHKRKRGSARIQIVSLPQISFSNKREIKKKSNLVDAINKIAKSARTRAIKRAKKSVLNIVAPISHIGRADVSLFVQEDFGFVIASVEVDEQEYLTEIIDAADGIVDIFFVDASIKEYLEKPLIVKVKEITKKSRVIGYCDSSVWIRSVNQEIRCLIDELFECKIVIIGVNELSEKLAYDLATQGARISLLSKNIEKINNTIQFRSDIFKRDQKIKINSSNKVEIVKNAKVIVSFARNDSYVTPDMVELMDKRGIVFDAGIGGVSRKTIELCIEKGIRVIRPDMRAALSSELASILGTERVVNELMGRKHVAGVSVVAGGQIGKYGDVIVDSIKNPTKVVGIADGKGRVIYEKRPEFNNVLNKVESEIINQQIN